MIQTITQDNLLRYIYGETSQEEASFIEEALLSDWELQEIFQTLVESKNLLDSASYEPRNIAVRRILEYSRDKAAHEHYM